MTRGLLLDTHIWIWSLEEPSRLTGRLRRRLDRAESLWLSPVSTWELALLIERGRVGLDRPIRAWVDEAFRRAPLRDATLSREVVLRSRDVGLGHDDPADRFLAATAAVHDLTLVTADSRLLAGTGYQGLANR